jgi:predicted kinase
VAVLASAGSTNTTISCLVSKTVASPKKNSSHYHGWFPKTLRRLPRLRLLCYKPNMRKWMRERLQRRKKKPTAEGGETTPPPPLQPAYFEAEIPPHRPPEQDRPESQRREAPKKEAAKKREIENESASADSTAPGDRAASQAQGEPISRSVPADRNRGRRRRGGRGRGGRDRQQSVARAFTPAVVKGIVEAPLEETPSASGRAAPPVAESAAPTGQPTLPPVVASRTPKGVVVLAIGLPGSGKSSWFKRNNVVPLSSDMVRALLFDDPAEQRFQDLVFSNLRSMLKARLIARRPMNYVDATNLTPQERHNWIKLAKDYGYEVQAVFFDVPLEVCIERHQRRDRVVPEDVMRRMATKLKAPTFDEGFSKITVVRVKKKTE